MSVAGEVPLADHPVTFRFEDGHISGSSGCNTYYGAAWLVAGRLFHPGAMTTLVGCLGPVGRIEKTFTAVLRDLPSAHLADGRLVLSGVHGQLVFEAAGPAGG